MTPVLAASFALAALSGPALAGDASADAAMLDTCLAGADSRAAREDCLGLVSTACMDGRADGGTTLGITECRMAEAQAWDRHLNAAYADRMGEFTGMDAAEAEAAFATRADSLRAAQRAWIAFRDAECGLAYALWGAGSMRGIAAADCRMTMTAERAVELLGLGEEMR